MRVFKKILGYFLAVWTAISIWTLLTKPSIASGFAVFITLILAILSVYLISTSRKK